MDKPPEIIDLANIVDPYLNGGHLISYSSRYLTNPGDNYGSIMLSITANVRQANGTIEELPLVAKLPPLSNKMIWEIFSPDVTIPREYGIYLKIAPSIRQLQLSSGVPECDIDEIFAKCYGHRTSLKEGKAEIDRDAVLVLENLQTNGYKAGKRQVMFDYDHIKVVLKYTAKFHALSIALRLHDPDKFKNDVLPNYYKYDLMINTIGDIREVYLKNIIEHIKTALAGDDKVIDRCLELMKMNAEYMGGTGICEDGLFTTIAHFDLWINNVLVQYDESGAPSKVKIVDFQIAQYDSLAHDVVFLLLSSVEVEVLENHFDQLLDCYYAEFIACLKKTKCNVEEYSYEKFYKEIMKIAPLQIAHALYMAEVLLADDKNIPDKWEDYTMEDMKEPSAASMKKMQDIVRLSKKFGFFW